MRCIMLWGMLAMGVAGAEAPPAPPVSGTWHVKLEAASARRPDGSSSSRRAMEGTFALTQAGAEVTGTWRTVTPVDLEWPLKGRVDDDRIELASEWRDMPTGDKGQDATVRARWIFEGTVREDSLSGTAFVQIGDREPLRQKWSATRK